jgi:uncharacterized protein (TIGR03435 family)
MTDRLLIAAISVAAVFGQAPRPEFEVASMKPSAGGVGRSIGMDRAGDLNAKNVPLRMLIAEAYGVKPFQIYGAPGWINSDAYDVNAKPEVNRKQGPAKKEPFETMWADIQQRLQVLLEERCSLKVHHETKELPVYVLTVAKSGLKVRPADCIAIDPQNPPERPAPGDERPVFCGTIRLGRNGQNSTLTGTGVTMRDFVLHWLTQATGRTVIDKTGYTETFTAILEWTPDSTPRPPGADDPTAPPPASDPTGPSFFTALQEQLGLKLESSKGPVEVLVIDHVEKPSAN